MGSGVSAYKGTDGSEADACEAALMEALKLRDGLKRSSTVGLSGELGSLLLNRDVLRAGGTRAGSGSAYSQKRRRQMLSGLRSSLVLAEALSEKRAGRALCGGEEALFKWDWNVWDLAEQTPRPLAAVGLALCKHLSLSGKLKMDWHKPVQIAEPSRSD